MLDDVIARLKARCADFRLIEGAAELSALVQGGRAPNRTPAAFVIPVGLRATPPSAAAGLFRQVYSETIGVVIVQTTAGDARGAAGVMPVHGLRQQVIECLAGWGPGGFGVLELVRGSLVSLQAGTIIYQIDFSIPQQLRIAT